MKNIIAKALWCLPLWGVLALVYHLSSALLYYYLPGFASTPSTDTINFCQRIPDMLFIFWEQLMHVFFFAGQLALLLFIIERSNLVQAKYALALLFIAQCFFICPSNITLFMNSLQFMTLMDKWFEREFLFHTFNRRILTGNVFFLTALPGTVLLWYCLFKSKLFSTRVNVLYVAALTVYFGLTHVTLSFNDLIFWHVSLIIGSVLAIIAGYGIARGTKFIE